MFESLSDRLTGALAGLRGKGRLTDADIEATTREIRLALLEADVSLPVVRTFVNRIKERARGAEVRYAPVYCRRLPMDAAVALDRLVRSQPVDAVVVTSNEGLLNLYDCAGERHRGWLLSRRLAVIGERTAVLAATLGFERPARIAAEASDRGLVEALAALAQEMT